MEAPSFGGSDSTVEEPTVTSEPSTEVTTPTDEDLSLANPFLNEVEASHRAIVAPYIKKWDAGVTKKFQEYAAQRKQYEALGSYEDLQRFTNFARGLSQNPEKAFAALWNHYQETYGDEFEQHLPRLLGIAEDAMSEDFNDQEFEDTDNGAPDEQTVIQQNLLSEVEQLREWKENFETQQQEAEQNRQLDNLLGQMHNQFGDFDDRWILLQLSEHGDPNRAIKEWNEFVGKVSQNGSQRQAPKIMGGQGGVPSGQVDPTKLKGMERRKAVQDALSAIGD